MFKHRFDWLVEEMYSSLVISSLETTSGAHIVKFPSCIINVKFLLSRCAAKCYLYCARFHLCSLQQQFFSHPLRLHLRDRLNGNMSRYVLVVSIVQWQDLITNIFLNANSWFLLIFLINRFIPVLYIVLIANLVIFIENTIVLQFHRWIRTCTYKDCATYQIEVV